MPSLKRCASIAHVALSTKSLRGFLQPLTRDNQAAEPLTMIPDYENYHYVSEVYAYARRTTTSSTPTSVAALTLSAILSDTQHYAGPVTWEKLLVPRGFPFEPPQRPRMPTAPQRPRMPVAPQPPPDVSLEKPDPQQLPLRPDPPAPKPTLLERLFPSLYRNAVEHAKRSPDCAFRRWRPLVPTHGDHPFRSMATRVA